MAQLSGVSKTLLGAKNEFTLHVSKDYDYRFMSERRNEIIDIIKHGYAEKFNENLPIYGIQKDKLAEFTTVEKDFKRGINRFPPIEFRLVEEDVLAQTSIVSQVSQEPSDLQEDLKNNVDFRDKQNKERADPMVGEASDDDDDDDEEGESGSTRISVIEGGP